MATTMVMANSRRCGPPAGHEYQRKETAASEIVIESMVKLISLALFKSRLEWRLAFLHEAHRVLQKHDGVVDQETNSQSQAISERLSRLYPNRRMAMKVSRSDIGSATAGISVSVLFQETKRSAAPQERTR